MSDEHHSVFMWVSTMCVIDTWLIFHRKFLVRLTRIGVAPWTCTSYEMPWKNKVSLPQQQYLVFKCCTAINLVEFCGYYNRLQHFGFRFFLYWDVSYFNLDARSLSPILE